VQTHDLSQCAAGSVNGRLAVDRWRDPHCRDRADAARDGVGLRC